MVRRAAAFLLVIGIALLAGVVAIWVSSHQKSATPVSPPPSAAPAHALTSAPLAPRQDRPPKPAKTEAVPVSAPLVGPVTSSYWLRGVVLGTDRQPVPSFTIQLVPAGYAPLASPSLAKTFDAAFGEFELQWKERGPFDVIAKARGFTEGMLPYVELAPSRDEAQLWELVLVPEARIRGQVVDESDRPIAGAHVELGIYINEVSAIGGSQDKDEEALEAYLEESNPNPRQRSDAQGRFELTELPQGTYQLIASHPDFYPTAMEVALQPGGILDGIRLVLSQHGGALLVKVVDLQGGPLAGWSVGLEETPLHGKTDQQGTWRIDELPPGFYRVILSADEPSSADATPALSRWSDVAVTAGKTSEITFRVSPGILVRGEVTRAGQLVAGVGVSASQMSSSETRVAEAPQGAYAAASAMTDARGRFELPRLPAGIYELTVGKEDDQASFMVALAETDRDRSLRISLGDIRAEGVVRDGQTGQAIPGASVRLAPIQLEGNDRQDRDVFVATADPEVFTNESGRYRIDGLAAGDYSLDVSKANYGQTTGATVQVSGPVFVHDVRLWSRAQLILTVTDGKRVPLYRARVTVKPLADAEHLIIATTDSSGLVQLENLAAGAYEVLVDQGQSEAAPSRSVIEIKAGETKRLDVRLDVRR